MLMVIDAYIFRARLRLAKGVGGAVEDSARLSSMPGPGRPSGDFPGPRSTGPVLYEAGEDEEAGAAVDELLARWREKPTPAAGPWVEMAHVLEGLGAGHRAHRSQCWVACGTRWLSGGGNLSRVAMPSGPPRCTEDRSARRLGQDTPPSAESYLGRPDQRRGRGPARAALEFFRAAGAEHYIRDAEDLLAVS